jgi:hypothetical protein
MGTKFSDFMLEIENDARAEGPAAVRELHLLQKYYSQRRRDVLAGGMDKPVCFSENKMSATYAFVFNGTGDWKKSIADDWDLDVIELEGDEKTVGHRQIDGSICKIVQTSDGKLVAISK